MARKFITNYTFNPGTQTVKIPGYFIQEKILMITNVTTGEIIQQFASPTDGIASLTFDNTSTELDSVDGVTTIVLENGCAGMSSNDKLQVVVEDPAISVRPFDFGTDAIERMRIASPQSLIDADFEYGLQSTKWQSYSSVRNIPGIYELPGQEIVVANVITNNSSPYSTITVTANSHGLSNGNAITITGLSNEPPTSPRAEGSFLVRTPTTNTFTYIAKGYVGPNTNATLYTPYTTVRKAAFYATASIPFTSMVSNGSNPSIITVTCAAPHGLVPGHTLLVDTNSLGVNHTLAEGNFFVETTPTTNSFTYTALTGGAVSNLTTLTATIYSRSDSFNVHRPFDGGVLMGPDNGAHGARVLRQSKKYFRYQSGKGILFTTGTLLHPNYDVESVTATNTAVGAAITINTEQTHGLQSGASVILSGVTSNGYNGLYTVTNIVSEQTFTVTSANTLAATTAVLGDQPRIAVNSWHGSCIRAGLFDDQNGIFWESDGQKLYAVRRSSTFQLAGTATVTNNSTTVTGLSTRFADQLKVGDKIVVRGQSRLVTNISNNTLMYISPPFRLAGATSAAGVKVAKTIDYKVPQENFNRDSIDGTGASGYNYNYNKMQMLGIQYSWYGAGFIDFIIRGGDGNFVYAHRFKNNNVNDEAYLRSGNLPARYEIDNTTAMSTLPSGANSTQTFLTLANTYAFPSSGTVMVDNELISYTNRYNSNNTLTGCTRSATLSKFAGGSSRSFTANSAYAHANNSSVILVSCTCSPTLSHWGSSVIMDGGFDLDRGYFFNYSRSNFSVAQGNTSTAFIIRLAPTISNSIPADMGQRELINRSQILLEKLEIISDRNLLVTGILNPANTSAITWSNLNTTTFGSQPSFAQISQTFTGIAAPGEQILSSIVSAAGGLSTVDLKALKELGNGPIGGTGQYPDGPDVLAINIRNTSLSQAANVQINLFWSETQA